MPLTFRKIYIMKQGFVFLLLLAFVQPSMAQGGDVLQFEVPLPQAVAFYDFGGTGEKGFVSCFRDGETFSATGTLYFHDGFSSGFAVGGTTFMLDQSYNPQYAYVTGIDDVNGDGVPDIGIFASERFSGNLQWAAVSRGRSGGYDAIRWCYLTIGTSTATGASTSPRRCLAATRYCTVSCPTARCSRRK